MGLISNLLNSIRKIDVRYNVREYGAMPIYPDAKIQTFFNAYSNNASVFSIVNLAARKFGFIPRYLMKEEDEEAVKQYKKITKSSFNSPGSYFKASSLKKKAYSEIKGKGMDLENLLMQPNPMQGQDAFFYSVYVSYKLAGEAFIWLNRGDIEDTESADNLPVLEMWLLPANLIELVPDKDDVWGVTGYKMNLDGKMVDIRKSDVIHWKTFNPNFDTYTRSHLRGLPPLKAGTKVLTMDEDSTNASVAMYQNGGARGVLYEKSLRNISPTQKAAIEDITAKRVNNQDMKSAIANLQGDWGYIDIGKDSVDMQLLDGNDKAMAKLCHIFGVPPGLFLIDQTYENQRSNRKRMLSELIIPDCQSFNDEMNRQLLPAFGLVGYEIEPDYSELPEMQEDMRDMITYLKDSPITLNEFRDALGYDPLDLDGMDMIYVNSSQMPVDGGGIALPDDTIN